MLRVKLATMKQQGRRANTVRAALHLTDKNDVITLFVTAAVKAFKRGRSTRQQRCPTSPFDKRDIGKTIHIFAGESFGQRLLVCAQNIDGVMRASAKCLHGRRAT